MAHASETCPICHQPLTAASPREMRPFCSSRCRLLDLSKWLSEDYAIAGPPVGDGGVDHLVDDDDEGGA